MARTARACSLSLLLVAGQPAQRREGARARVASPFSEHSLLHTILPCGRCAPRDASCLEHTVRAARAAPRPNSSCTVLVDRHVPKTAGSSVRFLMRAAEAKGWCAYWGYAVAEPSWRRALGAIRTLASTRLRPAGAAPARSPRALALCVELHALKHMATGVGASGSAHPPNMLRSHFAPLHALRDELGGRCTVVSSVRVREPLAWYRSFFGWAVGGIPFVVSTPCAVAHACTSTELFERFVALAPNLQTSMFLRAHPPAAWASCAPARGCRWVEGGAPAFGRPPPAPLSAADLREALAAIDTFDIVDVVERFDRFVAQLSLRARWPNAALPYVRFAPPAHAQMMRTRCDRAASAPPGAANPKLRAFCEHAALFRANVSATPPCASADERRRCAAAVATHAPMDAALYLSLIHI